MFSAGCSSRRQRSIAACGSSGPSAHAQPRRRALRPRRAPVLEHRARQHADPQRRRRLGQRRVLDRVGGRLVGVLAVVDDQDQRAHAPPAGATPRRRCAPPSRATRRARRRARAAAARRARASRAPSPPAATAPCRASRVSSAWPLSSGMVDGRSRQRRRSERRLRSGSPSMGSRARSSTIVTSPTRSRSVRTIVAQKCVLPWPASAITVAIVGTGLPPPERGVGAGDQLIDHLAAPDQRHRRLAHDRRRVGDVVARRQHADHVAVGQRLLVNVVGRRRRPRA